MNDELVQEKWQMVVMINLNVPFLDSPSWNEETIKTSWDIQ
jgi:hypothetical protein